MEKLQAAATGGKLAPAEFQKRAMDLMTQAEHVQQSHMNLNGQVDLVAPRRNSGLQMAKYKRGDWQAAQP